MRTSNSVRNAETGFRVMDFETLERDIAQLNRINPNANYTSRDRYKALYNSIYERLLEMEKGGEIVLEPGKKGLAYPCL